jgi:hypothetical protein
MSAEDLLAEIRKNIDNFINTDKSQFTPFNLSRTGTLINYPFPEDELWASSNPVTSVLHIEIGADDGSVICSYNDDAKWRFTKFLRHLTGPIP